MAIENRGPELEAVGYTLVSVALVSVLLRCYTRVFKVKSFGFDDWCMAFALCTFILFVACALVGVKYGTGRHEWDLDDGDMVKAFKFWWYCYLWYCLTMIASKISIGYFLLRITIRRVDVWIIYGVMLLTVLTGIAFFFITMFQCSPISFFWNKSQSGSCLDMNVIIAITYLYSVCSVICDFTFALLPIFIIWKLNINKRSKLALAPIMLMACVASAAVVVRFPYIQNFKKPDFLFSTIDIAIWSTTEQGLAITAGSLATLRPLIRSIGHRLGLSVHGPSQTRNSDPRDHPPTIGQKRSHRNGSHRQLYSLNTFTALGSFTEGDRHDLGSGNGRSEHELLAGEGTTSFNAPPPSHQRESEKREADTGSQGVIYKSRISTTTSECI